MDFNNWGNTLNTISSFNPITDSKCIQLETAKKALQLYQSSDPDTQDVLLQICLASATNDHTKLAELLSNPENLKFLTQRDNSGITPLIYSICFGEEDTIETILSKSRDSINEFDNLIGYTPLMWAVYLGKKDLITELLNHGADLNMANSKGVTVFDLVKEHTSIYDYFEEHGLLKEQGFSEQDSAQNDIFYTNDSAIAANGTDDDELLNNIKLKTAGLSPYEQADGSTGNGFYQSNDIFTNDNTSSSNIGTTTSSGLFQDDFNFNKLLKNQYIMFSDYDIPSIIDLLFKLNDQFNHKTTYPAAILYQCVRYADHVKENDILVENFLNLAFTKIRATFTTSTTGVANVYHNGDIVLQSYWVSVLNFLYYYLLKDDSFFKRYPKVLEDLSVTLHSLIIELTNSMKFRLEDLVDECLLYYTNIPEISSTLYKNDWNFFKKKPQANKKSSYDEIYQMLYPPSLKDQAKRSPIKVVQTLGALLYVLDLHHVHPIITQETLSIVFHWLGSTIFNRIVSQKKLLTRSKAIQIRLNLSILEDWARSNNRQPKLKDGELDISLLLEHPLNLLPQGATPVHSVMRYKGNSTDCLDAAFYRKPLFHILQSHFEPTWELLQWLQCFTMLTEEDSVLGLVASLTKLNERQLLKTIDKYRYEVDEEKFSKVLYKIIQVRSKQQEQNKRLFYLKNDELVQLNQDYQFPVLLPVLQELVDEYGAGLGGVHRERSLEFQPFLPIPILDSIDEIHEQKTQEIAKQTEQGLSHDSDSNNNKHNNEEAEVDDNNENEDGSKENRDDGAFKYGAEFQSKDDGLFKELTVPESLARRQWGFDDENTANPWN